jgi:hypothetical protein
LRHRQLSSAPQSHAAVGHYTEQSSKFSITPVGDPSSDKRYAKRNFGPVLIVELNIRKQIKENPQDKPRNLLSGPLHVYKVADNTVRPGRNGRRRGQLEGRLAYINGQNSSIPRCFMRHLFFSVSFAACVSVHGPPYRHVFRSRSWEPHCLVLALNCEASRT